jgi:hypothetical protein
VIEHQHGETKLVTGELASPTVLVPMLKLPVFDTVVVVVVNESPPVVIVIGAA